MKVFLDTNILIFASINRSEYIRSIVKYISTNCDLLLSDYIIREYEKAINGKKLEKYNCINILNTIFYERIISSNDIKNLKIEIRDINDYQVLYDAIKANADILITNDKDFDDVTIDKPRILSLQQFFKEFMQ